MNHPDLWLPQRQRTRVDPWRAEQFVLVARRSGVFAKVFSITFRRSWEVQVQLPYFRPLHGIVGRYILDNPPGKPTKLHLQDGGYVTEEQIKYSHHADGRARFSQQTRIWSLVENQSDPLFTLDGQLFTVMFFGLGSFVSPRRNDHNPPNPKRTSLHFEIDESVIDGAKIIGWWNPESRLSRPQGTSNFIRRGEPTLVRTRDGLRRPAFFLAPPIDWPSANAGLMLTVEPLSLDVDPTDPFLLIQGGFGSEVREDGVMLDDLSMLIAHYTDRSLDIERLGLELGTVDMAAWSQDEKSELFLTKSRRLESAGQEDSNLDDRQPIIKHSM